MIGWLGLHRRGSGFGVYGFEPRFEGRGVGI
jgi:hypothetical protein